MKQKQNKINIAHLTQSNGRRSQADQTTLSLVRLCRLGVVGNEDIDDSFDLWTRLVVLYTAIVLLHLQFNFESSTLPLLV